MRNLRDLRTKSSLFAASARARKGLFFYVRGEWGITLLETGSTLDNTVSKHGAAQIGT